MQVNFQQELQKAIEKTKSKISTSDLQFIKENYKYESIHGGFQYIIYAYRIHQLSEYERKTIQQLLKKGIGFYSSQSGHTIQSNLID
jgi:hypothetical protein